MPEINQDLKLQSDPTTIVRPNIVSDNIPSGAVTEAKLATGAVTQGKLASGAVGNAQLATQAVSADKIAPNAVTHAKIASGAVGNAQLATGAVSTSKCDFHVFEEITFKNLLLLCKEALGGLLPNYGDFITWYQAQGYRIYACSYDESANIQRIAIVSITNNRINIAYYDGSDWNSLDFLATDSVDLTESVLEEIRFLL